MHRSEEGGSGGGATTIGSRGEGLIAGRAALYPSSFECPAKLCLLKEKPVPESFSGVRAETPKKAQRSSAACL